MSRQKHPPLRFDDATHTYWVEGQRLPSVTQILEAEGFISSYCKDDEAAEYGNNVHLMVSLDVHGRLDEDSLDPGLRNPFTGWRLFRGEWPHLSPIKEYVEEPLYHHRLLYAGTPDLPMWMRSGRSRQLVVIDVKTTATPQAHHELQTAAYEPLLRQELKIRPDATTLRAALYLSHKSHKYRLIWHENGGDQGVFMGVYNAYRWKKAHGYLRDAEA